MGSVTEPHRVEALLQDLTKSMVERIMGTTSHAEALRALRAACPESPLPVRVAALAVMRRTAGDHIPR
jgi:hypothetical protein